jgi:hypothetical protein
VTNQRKKRHFGGAQVFQTLSLVPKSMITPTVSPLNVRNPSLGGEGILDSLPLESSFGNDGKMARCKICDTLAAMEPSICPEKGR